jgi:hypothetical protein
MAFRFHKVFAKPLGHTAQHADQHPRILFFVSLEISESTEYALLCVLAHSASVDKNNIRGPQVVRLAEPRLSQNAQDYLGVRQIHLAAVCF